MIINVFNNNSVHNDPVKIPVTHQTCKFNRFVTVAFVILKFKIIYDQYGIILTNDTNLICTNTCIYFVKMIQKSSTVDILRYPNTYLIVAKT